MSSFFNEAMLQMMYLLGYGLALPLAVLTCLGFILAILQSATQVQEQLLVFFPKILLSAALIYFGGNAFLALSSEYLTQMISLMKYVK